MGKAYVEEVQRMGLAASIKHFPGDGQDERDQHLVTSINSMDCDTWMQTYGAAYKASIDAGALTVMVGHIMQPAWTRRLNPEIKDEDIKPGTLSRELMQGLLRGELGFNGLICTDATTMAGYTLAMSRRRAVPESIARGADMFLFARNLEEDYGFMLQGIRDGIITPQRLDEAVTRILATKAVLGCTAKRRSWTWKRRGPSWAARSIRPGRRNAPTAPSRWSKSSPVCCPSPRSATRASCSIPLNLPAAVKGTIRLPPPAPSCAPCWKRKGLKCNDFVPQPYGEGFTTKYEEIVQNYDLILYAANLSTKSNQTVVRIEWKQPMGADCGHYLNDLPTFLSPWKIPITCWIFPRVKTYVNCYSNNDHCLHQLVEKLTGRSAFKGQSPWTRSAANGTHTCKTRGFFMDNELPTLQWKQNGVTHIVKLLPGGRIGSLCEEMLAEIRETGDEPDEKVKAIRRGDVHTVRRLQKPEGKELASAPLHEWEETIQGPSGPFPVTPD